MAGLCWLHLSDWHQKGPDFDRIVVRDKLIDDIRNRGKIDSRLEHVDFVVFRLCRKITFPFCLDLGAVQLCNSIVVGHDAALD